MTDSPSVRIAAELRGRIARGELRPGERVPSAREITRSFGVAVATASRVLAALREDGLVHVVPGVGTLVSAPDGPASAGPPARPAPRATGRADEAAGLGGRAAAGPSPVAGLRTAAGATGSPAGAVAGGAARSRRARTATRALDLRRIVATAVAVADAEGLDGLSMRRVAAELGAGPMSLYRHVADKDDLLLHMMDAALREAHLPAVAPPGWRPCLEVAARSLWAAFRRHPWLAPALSLTRPQAVAGGLAYTEWVLAALAGAGLTTTVAFDVHLTLFTFVRGVAVNLESEAAAAADSGLTSEEWVSAHEPRLRAITGDGRYPHFERLIAQEYDLELDGLFERGLRYVLDGLAADLERTTST
jgi:AcrR family transcriptional regulator